MNDPANTTPEMLLRAASIARANGLKYIYAGNLPGQVGDLENTRCHACQALLVERFGYFVQQYRITPGGTCPDCHAAIPGRWAAKFEGQITDRPFLPGSRRLRTL
jgi:pyruvate formate lyase activating enzyme